jgi:hypothetical protein
MKKSIILSALLLSLSSVFAQCPANDSTIMGAGSVNDVYYSFKQFSQTGNGVVSVVSNTNWHLAFSVMPSNFPNNPANGVAIRVNSPLGENSQAQTTGTNLVKLPGANANNWRAVDTTGLYALQPIYDNDSTWNLSAFTRGYKTSDPFNFIWGNYNPSTHNVEGNGSVYVLYNKSANWYKKINVKEVTLDTMWHVIISNIDNTDSQYLWINKRAFKNRMFIYYNVLTNTLSLREPLMDQWDLVWTKYKGMVSMGGPKVPYTVTGVLSNPMLKVAKNIGKNCDQVSFSDMIAPYQNNISTIGYDWKVFTGMSYSMVDTFVYFVSTPDYHYYKVAMKSFKGGKTTFNVLQDQMSVEQVASAAAVKVFPNPTNGIVQIESVDPIEHIIVYNAMGQKMMDTTNSTIDLQTMSNGLYHIAVYTQSGLSLRSIVKS